MYLGRGSWAYDVVGRWMPRGMVGFLMGRVVGGELVGDASECVEWERVEREN